MSGIRNLSGASVDTSVSVPVSEMPDAGEALEDDQLAFNDALTDGGELNDSQSLETRKAIKRSLDRFQASPETDGASGSSEYEPADASQGGSTLRTAGQPDGPVPAGGTRRAAEPADASQGGSTLRTAGRPDGPVPAGGARRAAESAGASQGGSTLRTAGRPDGPVPAGGARRAAESAGASQGGSTLRTAGQPAGTVAADGPVSARGVRRTANAAGEGSVTATGRPQRHGPSSPPVSDGGNQGAPVSSLSSTKQSPATAERKQAGATAKGVPGLGQARAGSAVEARAGPTTPTTGTQAASTRVPDGFPASRTEVTASAGPDADDAHDPDTPAIDMTGVAAAGITESGHTSAPDGVQAPVSRAAELAEQVADRILVSMPDSNGRGEVRISLKQSILDGSDVRIFHEGGELKVVFVAATESAQRFLADNKALLQQTLGDRLQDQRVQVEVETPNRGGTSHEEDNRGRSRQQYVRQEDSSDAN